MVFQRLSEEVGVRGQTRIPFNDDFLMAFEIEFGLEKNIEARERAALQELIDRNHDGYVSKLEFKAFHEKLKRTGQSMDNFIKSSSGTAQAAVQLNNKPPEVQRPVSEASSPLAKLEDMLSAPESAAAKVGATLQEAREKAESIEDQATETLDLASFGIGVMEKVCHLLSSQILFEYQNNGNKSGL